MHPEATPMEGDLHEAVSVFVQLRPRLFGIAYRVLGSAAEAEDVVQEVWLRWQHTTTDRRRQPRRLPVERHHPTGHSTWPSRPGSAARPDIGPWLPEPIDTSNDPQAGAERAEALELALLLVLEKLPPTERAAYVLREAFDYSYPDIARILGLEPRQRAQDREPGPQAPHRGPAGQRRRRRAPEAARRVRHRRPARGHRLVGVAAHLGRAVSLSDGNGRRGAARVPVIGRTRVANLSTAFPRFWPTVEVETVEANGRAGVVLYRDGRPATFMTVAATRRGIHQVMWVFSPNKMAALLRSREGSGAGAGADSGAGAGLREVVFSTV